MITHDPETELQLRFKNSCIMASELTGLSKDEEYFHMAYENKQKKVIIIHLRHGYSMNRKDLNGKHGINSKVKLR